MSSKSRVQPERIQTLNSEPVGSGPIVYWMNRDHRAEDNWALLHAQDVALQNKTGLEVVFCLRADLSKHCGTERMWDFMSRSLAEVAETLHEHHISFRFIVGDPITEIPQLVEELGAGAVITDFFPLTVYRNWKQQVADSLKCSMQMVDAHNIVPCWIASDKQEFAARSFRPKLHKKLKQFLTPFPQLKTMSAEHFSNQKLPDWKAIRSQVILIETVKPVDWLQPGSRAAHSMWQHFLEKRLHKYQDQRNDPTQKALSNMSPYLHFGQIAAQRLALDLQQHKQTADVEAYFEELVVRRELSDNFCYYNHNYDSVEGFPDWAKENHRKHAADRREFEYTRKQFEAAQTHEPLWNAAQNQLVKTGKLHGYMRMYWAKKILEWSESPAAALKIAQYLNDTYLLDGRDPNGYVGIAWSVGGVHDRPWFERPVFGKIRYMNANGAARKFAVQKYINQWNGEAA